MREEYWIVRLKKPNGETGYMNFKNDITNCLKYVATFSSEDQCSRALENIPKSPFNSQAKRWLKEGAAVEHAKLVLEVQDGQI
jgi:hypothetical protein